MINFEFYNPARIIFGKDTESQAGKQISKFGKRVLLHYGGGSVKANGVYDKVVKSLKEEGLFFVELSGVVPNPRLSLVREGIELCKKNNLDFVLAVGGGSVIDSAKAIAAGVRYSGDVWELYMDNSKLAGLIEALPVGVVLTIPAAGSESSTASVITNEEGWLKRAINTEVVIPKFAVLNPESSYTLPAYQTACGASDIFAHLMERYFTQEPNVDFTDRLIEANMRTILNNAPLALKNPNDYNVRAEIMWAGAVAHNNLLNTGRIGDWGSHDIEHEISGAYDIAHGAGLSIVFPAWMKYVYKQNVDKFIQFAMRVFNVDFSFDDKEKIVFEMIERLEDWYVRMGLPIRLSDVNIGSERIREMADKCMVGRTHVGNFQKLKTDDIYEIYKLAL